MTKLKDQEELLLKRIKKHDDDGKSFLLFTELARKVLRELNIESDDPRVSFSVPSTERYLRLIFSARVVLSPGLAKNSADELLFYFLVPKAQEGKYDHVSGSLDHVFKQNLREAKIGIPPLRRRPETNVRLRSSL